jgi:hypothetical protein
LDGLSVTVPIESEFGRNSLFENRDFKREIPFLEQTAAVRAGCRGWLVVRV